MHAVCFCVREQIMRVYTFPDPLPSQILLKQVVWVDNFDCHRANLRYSRLQYKSDTQEHVCRHGLGPFVFLSARDLLITLIVMH